MLKSNLHIIKRITKKVIAICEFSYSQLSLSPWCFALIPLNPHLHMKKTDCNYNCTTQSLPQLISNRESSRAKKACRMAYFPTALSSTPMK